jgi:hypothetical protein
MRIGHRRGLATAALALAFAAGQYPVVQSVLAAPTRPVILGVRSDLVNDTITITGRDFGDAPAVTLGATPLVVTSAGDASIVAELPAGVSGMNHLLAVAAGNRSDQTTIWIPGEGILTRGPIAVESTESNVRIVAGTSRVTVDPAGGVQIDSAGPLTLNAGGALTLRGTSVRIDSATSIRLNAATSLDLSSNATARLASGGVMTVTGSVIRLN